jgi:hypothetical protein
MRFSPEVKSLKLRSVFFVVLVIFALVAAPVSADGDSSKGKGPGGAGAPGQSDDGSRPGNGYGDQNHDHYGPPGQVQVDWLPCI